MTEFADPKLIAHWEARLAECEGGANIARAALRRLGVIHPIHEVIVDDNQLRLPEWPDGEAA